MTAVGEEKIFNFELFLTAEITDEKPLIKVKPDYVYVSVAKKDKKKWDSLTRNDQIKKKADKDKFKNKLVKNKVSCFCKFKIFKIFFP